MKPNHIILFVAYLIFSSLYFTSSNELFLIIIPAISLFAFKFSVDYAKIITVLLFFSAFLISSILLFMNSTSYNQFGVLAYTFFFASVLIVSLEYIFLKHTDNTTSYKSKKRKQNAQRS